MEKVTVINNLPEYIKKRGGSVDKKGTLNFPKNLGNGYLKIIKLSQHFTVMLQHFEVKENLTIKRARNADSSNNLVFSFRNVMTASVTVQKKSTFKVLPSVQVSTSDVALDIKVPAHSIISNIIIGVERDFLKQLLQNDRNLRLKEFVNKKEQSYLYEEVISPKIQSVAAEIFRVSAEDDLVNFHYKIKSEELIYLFMLSLLQRDEIPDYPINQNDIKAVYSLREEILKDLSIPPELNTLSEKINMSLSKLGKIFRQIFGDSIYNYYQKIRMQQAGFLLREEKLSVSEVGYRLGFSNLSHFTRLFKKHTGMNPKKFSSLRVHKKLQNELNKPCYH